jgi:hypothetical protein
MEKAGSFLSSNNSNSLQQKNTKNQQQTFDKFIQKVTTVRLQFKKQLAIIQFLDGKLNEFVTNLYRTAIKSGFLLPETEIFRAEVNEISTAMI